MTDIRVRYPDPPSSLDMEVVGYINQLVKALYEQNSQINSNIAAFDSQFAVVSVSVAALPTAIVSLVDVSAPNPTAGQVLTFVSGEWTPSSVSTAPTSFRGALVTLSTDVSVADGVVTTIAWASATYDTNSFFSGGAPSRLTVPSGVGAVRLASSLIMTANTSGDRLMRVLKNGGAFTGEIAVNTKAPTAAGGAVYGGTSPISVSSGDYFEITIQQNSGVTLSVLAQGRSWFSIEVLA